MLKKGKLFLVNNKVYKVKLNLLGYDEYFLKYEISRLLKLNIIEKIRNATEDDMKNKALKSIEYPKC